MDKRVHGFGPQTAKRLLRISGKKEIGKNPIEGQQLWLQSSTRFFTLLEDMPNGHGSHAAAAFYSWTGFIENGDLYNWGDMSTSSEGILDGAKAGYWGTAELMFGRWRFEQGPCIEPSESEGVLSYPAELPKATLGSPYTTAPSQATSVSNIQQSGLPAGLSVSSTTGIISGTPTEAGLFPTTVTGLTPDGNDTATLTVYRTLEVLAS
jgi:hypothetical protein